MKKTTKLTYAGIFAAMITLMTAYILHIPYGSNGGYVHFGDTLIYLAAVLLPRPYALFAAIVGAGFADLLTAPMWFLPTIIIKALIILPFTSAQSAILSKRNNIAPFFAGMITILGYYIAEYLLFGSFATALLSIPGNIIQVIGSGVFFLLAAHALDKIHLKKKEFTL